MARKYAPFGTSPVDALVKNFLERKNIDPNDITGYTLRRSVDNFGTIEFSMFFDEEPTQSETDAKE